MNKKADNVTSDHLLYAGNADFILGKTKIPSSSHEVMENIGLNLEKAQALSLVKSFSPAIVFILTSLALLSLLQQLFASITQANKVEPQIGDSLATILLIVFFAIMSYMMFIYFYDEITCAFGNDKTLFNSLLKNGIICYATVTNITESNTTTVITFSTQSVARLKNQQLRYIIGCNDCVDLKLGDTVIGFLWDKYRCCIL